MARISAFMHSDEANAIRKRLARQRDLVSAVRRVARDSDRRSGSLLCPIIGCNGTVAYQMCDGEGVNAACSACHTTVGDWWVTAERLAQSVRRYERVPSQKEFRKSARNCL